MRCAFQTQVTALHGGPVHGTEALVRRGPVLKGEALHGWCGLQRMGRDRLAWLAMAKHGVDRPGIAGMAWTPTARHGMAGTARPGSTRQGMAWFGLAG